MGSVDKSVIIGYDLTQYVLTAGDQTLKVLPGKGGNAWYYEAGGYQWLIEPSDLNGKGAHPGVTYGIPILFPSPNRVPDGKYRWQDQEYLMRKNGTPYWIHGLTSDEPFEVDTPVASLYDAQLPLHYTITPETPWWESFPFACRLEVIWTLDRCGLLFSYTLHNQGDHPLPFGIALHPFFRKLLPDADILLRVPADQVMIRDENVLPTGEIRSVEGTGSDLREYRAIADLDLNDVYFGMRPDMKAEILYRAINRKMTLTASESFSHLVVFTPKDRPVFCLENQSCSANAHNLYARGHHAASGLQVLKPGCSCGGWVRFTISEC